MNVLDRYLEYAEAFERTFADDDWSPLEPYFTAERLIVSPD
jgi:hypothetical protein